MRLVREIHGSDAIKFLIILLTHHDIPFLDWDRDKDQWLDIPDEYMPDVIKIIDESIKYSVSLNKTVIHNK